MLDHSITLKKLVRTTALLAAMTLIALAPSTGDAAGADCDPKALTFAKVAAACREGGKKAVTTLMKKVVKEANAAGTSMTCESCHTDLKAFGRKANAAADLEKFLK